MANVQSINNKIKEIENFAIQESVDIICVSEIWTTADQMTELKIRGFQQPACSYRSYGGVATYIREGIPFAELSPSVICEDSVWLQVQSLDRLMVIGNVYRSPNSSRENNDRIIATIREVSSTCPILTIVGDFNLPDVNWEYTHATSSLGNQFVDCFDDCFLYQLVEKPTRY